MATGRSGSESDRKFIHARLPPDVVDKSDFQQQLAEHLIEAMFAYLRLKNQELGFDVSDPVPSDDVEFGKSNGEFFIILDAAKHKDNLKRKTKANESNRQKLAIPQCVRKRYEFPSAQGTANLRQDFPP